MVGKKVQGVLDFKALRGAEIKWIVRAIEVARREGRDAHGLSLRAGLGLTGGSLATVQQAV